MGVIMPSSRAARRNRLRYRLRRKRGNLPAYTTDALTKKRHKRIEYVRHLPVIIESEDA